MHRRAFIASSAAAILSTPASGLSPPGPSDGEACSEEAAGAFVWRPMMVARGDIPALNGHTDTVPDIVGRLGSRIDLAIFTEGNHFPVLLGGDIIDPFRGWARAHAKYSGLTLDNIVIVTLPQPMIVGMLKGHGISLGNLTLDVSRASEFYPDIVMAGAAPLKVLHQALIVDAEARVFARNRGLALMVAAGNPLGIRHLDDLARGNIRVVLASASEPGAREQYIATLEGLLAPSQAKAALARETVAFPGRIGIQHRDVLHAIALRAAEVGIIVHHLALYFATAYPEACALVEVPAAGKFSSTIAMVRAVDPLRATAAKAFSEFFLGVAREVYPRHGFAAMSAAEYGETIALG
jgi:hypothetical protein